MLLVGLEVYEYINPLKKCWKPRRVKIVYFIVEFEDLSVLIDISKVS